jgi:hypothetical protein
MAIEQTGSRDIDISKGRDSQPNEEELLLEILNELQGSE